MSFNRVKFDNFFKKKVKKKYKDGRSCKYPYDYCFRIYY